MVFINSSYWVQEVYILSTCEVNLEHLVKVVFAMFLYSKVIVFPIVINEYWETCEILLDYANILFLLRLSPTNFNIQWWILPIAVMAVIF